MRYIIGLLLGIGLIVLTFILIIKAFTGHGSTPNQRIDLNDYATSSAVMRYTVDGPINSDQQHSRVRITVSKDQVVYEQIQGYEGKLVQTKTYPTNVQSYSTFLRALKIAGYTNGDPKKDDDERGYCPQGRRYVYEALDGGDTILRWWSSTCGGAAAGNFGGEPSTVRTLFERQVPDYNKLTQGVRI
jgi:hypothetical protein